MLVLLLLLERIEASVLGVALVPEHGGLEDVARVGGLLEQRLVEDLEGVDRLVVEGDQLQAARPEVEGREVGAVEAARVRVAADQLGFRVADHVQWPLLAHLLRLGFVH